MQREPEVTLTYEELSNLQEKGRQRALSMLQHNAEARERIERQFGVEYCKRRYPELYGINRPPDYAEPTGTGGIPGLPLITP